MFSVLSQFALRASWPSCVQLDASALHGVYLRYERFLPDDHLPPRIPGVFILSMLKGDSIAIACRDPMRWFSALSPNSNDANVRHHAGILVLADVAVIDEIAGLGERNSNHNG